MADDGWSMVKNKKKPTTGQSVTPPSTPPVHAATGHAAVKLQRNALAAGAPVTRPGRTATLGGMPSPSLPLPRPQPMNRSSGGQNFVRAQSSNYSSKGGEMRRTNSTRDGGDRPRMDTGMGSITPQNRTSSANTFFDEGNDEAEKLAAATVEKKESYTCTFFKEMARMLHSFRSGIDITDELLAKTRVDFGGGGGERGWDRGGRGGRSGGTDFVRGNKIGDATPEGRIDRMHSKSDPFARGHKTLHTPAQGRHGGRRGGDEDGDCDPDLVIERINASEFLKEAGGAEAVAADAEVDEAPEENFVRSQARRKLGEDDNAKTLRKLRGFLNKLTDLNFDAIFLKTTGEEGIKTKEQLEVFIQMVFDKASQMDKFLVTFSQFLINLREAMIEKKVVEDAKAFKQNVLNVAQETFNQVVFEPWAPDESLDTEEKLNAGVQMKNRRKGLCNFVANLTANGILSTKIVGRVVDRLFADGAGTKEDPQPVSETYIEVVMALYESVWNGCGVSWIGGLYSSHQVKLYELLKNGLPKIVEIVARTDEATKPSTRILYLLQNLIEHFKTDPWDVRY